MSQERMSVAALVGSLRRGSYNRGLLRSAMLLAPESMHLYEVPIDQLPLFNEDLERPSDPASVREFKRSLDRADAIIIFSPEYSYSVPGVLKNALDWASRPAGRSVMRHRPVALAGASAGRSGTMRSQMHLRQILIQLGAVVMAEPEVYITFASDKFNAVGELADQSSLDQLRALLGQLENWSKAVNSIHYQ